MSSAIFIFVGMAILILLFWLLFAPKWGTPRPAIQPLEIEQLQPLHCRHFSQIRFLLRQDDLKFVERNAPPELARAWKRDRRKVLRKYLNGLAEDLARLEHLARMIASLSPEVSRQREWEWFWLGLKFRLIFQLLVIRIALGERSLPQLARLTDLVASHAAKLEVRMSQMAGVLPSRLRPSAGI